MVKVRFFAVLKKIVGQEEIAVPIERSMPLSDFLSRLGRDLPQVSQILKEGKVLISINQEVGREGDLVADGDEIAFLPPFAGGDVNKEEALLSRIRIQEANFSVEEETNRIRESSKRIGGIVTFLGTARDFSKGRDIHWIDFEHYPQMAQKKLAEIRERALADFDIIDAAIIHRVGRIAIGENIVLIVVGAEHRKDAFAACSWCIDELKRITPIWKRETTPSGEVWVEEHP